MSSRFFRSKVKVNPLEKAFQPCPDFELAPLTQYPREIFLTSNTHRQMINGIIIGLAVAFNDIKDVFWVDYQLDKGKPSKPGATTYNGQWSGMAARNMRLAAGIMFEVINTLRRNKKLFQDDIYLAAVNK